MMDYSVVVSEQAEKDLAHIYSYIRSVLKSEINADSVLARLCAAMDDLRYMAGSHRLYPREPWRTKGVRFFPVGNYTVFYIADEQKRLASVVHVAYGRRDFDALLSS